MRSQERRVIVVVALLAVAAALVLAALWGGRQDPVSAPSAPTGGTAELSPGQRQEIEGALTGLFDGYNREEVVQAWSPVPRRTQAEGEVASSDLEWAGFPRSTFPFAARIRRSASDLRPHLLFRHVELNPGDEYIAPALRQMLAGLLQSYIKLLDDFAQVRGWSTQREMRALVEQGLALEKPLVLGGEKKDGFDSRKYRDVLARYPIMHIHGGRVYFASVAQLPLTKEAIVSEEVMGIEFGLAICQWFQQAGVLPSNMVSSIYEGLTTDDWRDLLPRRGDGRSKRNGP